MDGRCKDADIAFSPKSTRVAKIWTFFGPFLFWIVLEQIFFVLKDLPAMMGKVAFFGALRKAIFNTRMKNIECAGRKYFVVFFRSNVLQNVPLTQEACQQLCQRNGVWVKVQS